MKSIRNAVINIRYGVSISFYLRAGLRRPLDKKNKDSIPCTCIQILSSAACDVHMRRGLIDYYLRILDYIL